LLQNPKKVLHSLKSHATLGMCLSGRFGLPADTYRGSPFRVGVPSVSMKIMKIEMLIRDKSTINLSDF
ncbi:MAG: hypothetical protein ACLS8D_18245, partial [Clostridioides difficile]